LLAELGSYSISMPDQARMLKMSLRLIPFKELKPQKGLGYSRDHLRAKIKAGEFPSPVALSNKAIAWLESDIDDWIAARAALRHQPTKVA
jgi:prophage regulatory protein